MPDTVNEIASELLAWIRAAVSDAEVTVRGHAEPPAKGVEVRLLSIGPLPQARMVSPPTVLTLDYLISVRHADPLEEHRLAVELMFAALERRDFEVVDDVSAADAAHQLGLPPAAGLIVRTHLSRSRNVERAPVVRFPLVTSFTGVGRVEGIVLGPNDTPIAGAAITLVGLGRSARTDAHGRFQVAGPLPDTARILVKARARGVEAEITTKPGTPAIVHLPLEI